LSRSLRDFIATHAGGRDASQVCSISAMRDADRDHVAAYLRSRTPVACIRAGDLHDHYRLWCRSKQLRAIDLKAVRHGDGTFGHRQRRSQQPSVLPQRVSRFLVGRIRSQLDDSPGVERRVANALGVPEKVVALLTKGRVRTSTRPQPGAGGSYRLRPCSICMRTRCRTLGDSFFCLPIAI
jgi:hypothetical protein